MSDSPVVLIIEDMSVIREPLGICLQEAGMRVHLAPDGESGLDFLRTSRADLVLLDLGLPGVQGVEVLRRIRAWPPTRDLPVIVVSVYANIALVRKAAELGIQGYFVKTEFALERLVERVGQILGVQGQSQGIVATIGDAAEAAAPDRAHRDKQLSIGSTSEADSDADAPAQALQLPTTLESSGTPPRPLAGGRARLLQLMDEQFERRGASPAMARVLELLDSPKSTLDDITHALAQDPDLALRVLRLANSAAYATGEQTDSLKLAVSKIGTRGLRDTVVGIELAARFGDCAAGSAVSSRSFWEHSAACGLIAAQLAKSTAPDHAEALLSAGLIHDLGRLLFAEVLGERYSKIVDIARSAREPLEIVERKVMGIDHAEALASVLRHWRMPRSIVSAIAAHHLGRDAVATISPADRRLSITLAIADRLANALGHGSSGDDMLETTAAECRMLGLNGEAVTAALSNLAPYVTELTSWLSVPGGSHSGARETDVGKDSTAMSPNALYVSRDAACDAYSYAVHRLAPTPRTAAPQVVVVHPETGKDVGELMDRAIQVCHHASGRLLPMLLITSFDASKLVGRSKWEAGIRFLRAPMLVECLDREIRSLAECSSPAGGQLPLPRLGDAI